MEDLKTKIIAATSNLVSKEEANQNDTNRLSILTTLLSVVHTIIKDK